MKKIFILSFLFYLNIACANKPTVKSNTERPEKPNVLLILTDDFGWQDVKCYDIDEPSPYETPSIDRLAKNGVLFWQAYSPATTCSPSRGSIISGKHPVRVDRTSVRGGHPPMPFVATTSLISPWQNGHLPDEHITIAESLKTNGYKTGHSGKWHAGVAGSDIPEPKDQGFDFSKHGFGTHKRMIDRTTGFATTDDLDPFQLDENGFPFDDITQDGIDFMKDSKEDPFFLFYCSRLVHTPIHSRSEALLKKYYKKLGIEYPRKSDVWDQPGQKNAYYAAMVEMLDYYIGQLVVYLEKTDDPRWPGHKLIDNTYIIFTSDNGGMEAHTKEIITDNFPLDKGKINAKEGGTRVPLIITGPTIDADIQSDVMVNGVDFYPTILSWTNTKKQKDLILDGADLSELLDKNPNDSNLVIDPWTKDVRNTMMWHFPNSSMQSTLRVGDYKLIRQYNTSKEKYSLELYQLYHNGSERVDIEEANNLVFKMPEKAKEMNDLLQKRLDKLGARYPFFNPNSRKKIEGNHKVPTVVDHGKKGDKVWIKFKENGAKVIRVQLTYNIDGSVFGERWYPIDMKINNGEASIILPKGTTHYAFHLIDENNFLVGYPQMGYMKNTKIFSEKALQVK